jgi:hypothetical protein
MCDKYRRREQVDLMPPNGLRYRRLGGLREWHFDRINLKPRKRLENAQTPRRRVHAVLGILLANDSNTTTTRNINKEKIMQVIIVDQFEQLAAV